MIEPGSNRVYKPEHIESFWLSIWTGASGYIHCDWLRYDKTLQSIFGWKEMASQSTYSRFFEKFSQKRNTEVFPKLQHCFALGAWTVNHANKKVLKIALPTKKDLGWMVFLAKSKI